MTRAGFVTLVGRPNAGKSTLLNRLVGERLAIVSAKPQSTRDRVVGILSEADTQLVFLDTPGLLEPRYALHRAMRFAAQQAIADADVILHLQDASRLIPSSPASADRPPVAGLDLVGEAGLEKAPAAPVLPVLTQMDRLTGTEREAVGASQRSVLAVSAVTGEGIDRLLAAVRDRLPQSAFLYPADEVSTQHLRFFVREFLREAALEQLEEELPYGIAVEVEEFRESQTPVYIRAVLHVERESQKRIVIGAGGSRIRALGAAARARIEPLVGQPVFLDLWVKVLHNWRRDPAAIERLGYHLPKEPT